MVQTERPLGSVAIVGAGPGDPGLCTVRGRERLQAADVVLYDRLVSPEVLRWMRPDAEAIYVGKDQGEDQGAQDRINALLIERAKSGRRVVRLKGGDPFVFGRGGEEGEALREAGIPFEIVPGVSSALAVPAYAGIPLTHRRVAVSFLVCTGHEDPTKPESRVDWGHLAGGADTLVFLMAVRNLAAIAARLIAAGRPPETPAAAIEWGTTPRQRTVTAPLAEIASAAARAGIEAPAAIVVGDVVSLRASLAWYEGRPLFGRRILVTRARAQASTLAEALSERGALPVEFPTLSFAEPSDPARLDQAVRQLDRYDWVALTSANGVEALAGRLAALERDARAFGPARVAAVGPATAAALQKIGIRADLVPEAFTSAGLLDALCAVCADWAGQRVLFLRAEEGSAVAVEGLRQRGAQVEDVAAYRTVIAAGGPAGTLRLLQDGCIDAITFTSAATVRHFLTLAGRDALWNGEGGAGGGPAPRGVRPVIACIGTETARAAAEAGLPPDVVAAEHTILGLVAALEQHWAMTRSA